MIGILAESLDDALRSFGRAVESTSCERQESGDLLALADRVGRTVAGRGVAQNEPVHVRIGNRASDLGALLGVWRAGAVVVAARSLPLSALCSCRNTTPTILLTQRVLEPSRTEIFAVIAWRISVFRFLRP